MIPVILESPYAGEVGRNKLYLQACIKDCLRRGESPYASHQMLTEALNDLDPEERRLGIDAAQCWYGFVNKQVVYTDFGISNDMNLGIQRFQECNVDRVWETQYRSLGGIWWTWGELVIR